MWPKNNMTIIYLHYKLEVAAVNSQLLGSVNSALFGQMRSNSSPELCPGSASSP